MRRGSGRRDRCCAEDRAARSAAVSRPSRYAARSRGVAPFVAGVVAKQRRRRSAPPRRWPASRTMRSQSHPAWLWSSRAESPPPRSKPPGPLTSDASPRRRLRPPSSLSRSKSMLFSSLIATRSPRGRFRTVVEQLDPEGAVRALDAEFDLRRARGAVRIDRTDEEERAGMPGAVPLHRSIASSLRRSAAIERRILMEEIDVERSARLMCDEVAAVAALVRCREPSHPGGVALPRRRARVPVRRDQSILALRADLGAIIEQVRESRQGDDQHVLVAVAHLSIPFQPNLRRLFIFRLPSASMRDDRGVHARFVFFTTSRTRL